MSPPVNPKVNDLGSTKKWLKINLRIKITPAHITSVLILCFIISTIVYYLCGCIHVLCPTFIRIISCDPFRTCHHDPRYICRNWCNQISRKDKCKNKSHNFLHRKFILYNDKFKNDWISNWREKYWYILPFLYLLGFNFSINNTNFFSFLLIIYAIFLRIVAKLVKELFQVHHFDVESLEYLVSARYLLCIPIKYLWTVEVRSSSRSADLRHI